MLKRSATSPDWQAWASQKNWAYRDPASDLAGRFYPPPTSPGSGEEYPFAVQGTHGRLTFVCFARRVWTHQHRAERNATVNLAVRLPHTPRPDLRAMPAEHAFRSFGASLAGRFGYDWHGDNWLLGVGHDIGENVGENVEPVEVEMSLAQIDSQISLAPAELWEPGA